MADQQSLDRARRIDRTPCPRCGGDRLRADFTGSGLCHTRLPATPTDSDKEARNDH